MPVVSLLNPTANGKSIDQNSANLINLYLTEDSDQGKYPVAAWPTPGLTVFSTLNTPVRTMYEEHGITYAVGGSTFYSINSSGTATILGTLNTSAGFVKIRGVQQQLCIIDGTNGYNYNIITGVFTQITDTNFTQTATDIEAQDEIFMVLEPHSQTWQMSAISDGLTWTFQGLPIFASATGNNNNLVGIKTLQRQMWLFGTTATEVWYNAGQQGFTFARNSSIYIELGCAAAGSIAFGDNTLFVLGKSRNGGVVVFRMNGYSPVKISTRAIDYQISTFTTVSDAVGFCYYQEGHEFYVLTFPTAGVTWTYDMSTQMWHQRQSTVSGTPTRWIPNSYIFCYNKGLVGDYQSGNIYFLDMTNFTENTVAITRTLVTHPFYQAGAWVFVPKLQIDFDETSPSISNHLNLYVSKDGGRTFGAAKPATLAGAGPMISGPRVYWTRLGGCKNFVFKLTTSMNAKFIILGAWATIAAGAA